MHKQWLLVFIVCLAACNPVSAPSSTQMPTATQTALPTETPTPLPTASPTATMTYTPLPTATVTPSPSVTPTSTPRKASAPTARPTAKAAIGPIPPVGSGPFSVDEYASGPWNCVGLAASDGTLVQWTGDFYIGVQGGPGNYTISEPENCRWHPGELKFICRYTERINQQVMRTLYVSCPGCKQQAVALAGRGLNRGQGPGTCGVESIVFITPTPAAWAAYAQNQPFAPPFPRTAFLPWNQDGFVKSLQITRDITRSYRDYFSTVGRDGNCQRYSGVYYGEWESRPVFVDVPAKWSQVHDKYRVILADIYTTVRPITRLCKMSDEPLSDLTDQAILASLDNLVNRLDALYAEVQAIK